MDCTCVEGHFLTPDTSRITTNVNDCPVHGPWQVEIVPAAPREYDVPEMLIAFERWWGGHGTRWQRMEQPRRREHLDTFAAGYEACHKAQVTTPED